jgi:hypothetical protein
MYINAMQGVDLALNGLGAAMGSMQERGLERQYKSLYIREVASYNAMGRHWNAYADAQERTVAKLKNDLALSRQQANVLAAEVNRLRGNRW